MKEIDRDKYPFTYELNKAVEGYGRFLLAFAIIILLEKLHIIKIGAEK